MEKNKRYSLPELKYGYNELAPFMSEEQLKIHHQKHHNAYVLGANAIFEKLDKARKENVEIDMKAMLKELSFNIGGHVLHSLFWKNLAPAGKSGGGKPAGELGKAIDEEFSSFERFKQEFTKAAMTVEGSGWAALTCCKKNNLLLVMQIEKHNTNIYPEFSILLVLDMFEHAYYIDYKNDKAKYVEAFWDLADWGKAEERLNKILD